LTTQRFVSAKCEIVPRKTSDGSTGGCDITVTSHPLVSVQSLMFVAETLLYLL